MTLGLIDVDDLADLLKIVDGILCDLLFRQPIARLVPAAGIANQRGIVADDEHCLVA
jgi:hypothetical protein